MGAVLAQIFSCLHGREGNSIKRTSQDRFYLFHGGMPYIGARPKKDTLALPRNMIIIILHNLPLEIALLYQRT